MPNDLTAPPAGGSLHARPESTMNEATPAETLVWQGGAVKAIGTDGRVGGYLVLFGSPEQTDASPARDYFTADTDFGLDVNAKSAVLYHHGLDRAVGNRRLGAVELKADAVGIWAEGQLALRDAYEQRIYGMVRAGKMGWSSGSAEHLVRKEKQANGSQKITAWPLGLDASITPTPAEPRTLAVPLKSLPADALKLMAEGDDESGGSAADAGAAKCAYKAGDAVKWSGYGGMKKGHGKVVSVHEAGNVPGTENHVEATADSPAAKVHVRERLPEGGYKDTGRHQAHPVGRLRPDKRDAAKGLMMGDTDEAMTWAALSRLNDLFLNCFWRFIGVDIYSTAQILDGVGRSFDEYRAAALDVIETFLGDDEAPGDDARGAAAKAISDLGGRLHAGLTLHDHSDSVLAAVGVLSSRLERLVDLNAAEGRKLSRPRLEAVKSLSDALSGLLARAEAAAERATPSPTDLTRLQADLLRIEAREAGYLD